MHSPYEAVYGFDRTHIRRMTVQEYMNEDDTTIDVSSGLHSSKSGRMRSRDPNVQFSSNYPLYDDSGHELCLLYQILEMEVHQELQRVKCDDEVNRRSAVHLRTGAVPLDRATNKMSATEQHQHQQQQQLGVEYNGVYRPTPYVYAALIGADAVDDDENIDVSASSTNQLSGVASPLQGGTGEGTRTVRVSSFSIYRDSGLSSCAGLPHPQLQPHQQSEIISDGRHSATTTQPCAYDKVSMNDTYRSEGYGESRPPPRPRSNTASPVHSSKDGNGEREGFDAACTTGATLGTPAEAEPLRLTTVRPSDLRTTKQLFVPGRTTTTRRTIRHADPIPSRVYGLQSRAIPAAVVAPHIATNLEAFCVGGDFWSFDSPTPQLHPGAALTLGGCRYRILYYYASSDVYEAHEEEEGTVATPQLRPRQQILVYRWSVRAVQQGINEAHRAALGLSLTSSLVGVAGCRYSDGGVTVITMPEGYRAIPLSTVPLSARSFPVCVRLLLRMLSDLMVKRTVHGGLKALNHIFLAIRPNDVSADMPTTILVPVHWERLVDFSMFVDRNAGRTIPIVDEYGSQKSEHVYHGQDVLMMTSMLLECEHAGHLKPEQLVEVQRLMMMTTESMQIANYLIQLNNAMATIPSDMTSLRQEYEVALQCAFHDERK